MWGSGVLSLMLDSLVRDVRFAVREFRRTPGAVAIAVSAMILGIGGVTAVFSIIDRLMFRPLPYAQPDRLVWIGMKAPIAPDEFLLEADYALLREKSTVLEGLGAMSRAFDCDLNETEPLRLACTNVTWDLLPLLGIRPMIGRQFLEAEDRRGGPRAAMLTFAFWRSRFGSDPGVVGRVIQVDGRPVHIAGVLPPDFEQPNFASSDILLTWQLNLARDVQRSFMTVFGRLQPGISAAAARSALLPLYSEMQKGIPPGFRKEVSFHLTSMQERQIRDYRTASWFLLACVFVLLLISCANVANLLLARGAAREAEFAVRAALGAGKARIVRQSLTESLLLATAGGVLGLLFALALLNALKSWAPTGALRVQTAALDGRVLLFAIALTFLSALLFGLFPAMRAGSMTALRGARSIGRGWQVNQMIMAVQIGLSVVLLSGAVLFLQSVWKMQRVPLGMRPDGVQAVRLQLGAERYSTPEKRNAVFEQALERLSRIPGTRSAAASDSVPLYGGSRSVVFSAIRVDGRSTDAGRPTGGMVVWRMVTPSYFEVMGIPLVRGRAFSLQDRFGSEALTIIDETLAGRLFPGEEPLGKRIQPGATGPFLTIVGISRPVKNAGFMQHDDPEFYILWRLRPGMEGNRAHILLRSDAEPAELASFARAEIARIDPTVPVSVTTMDNNLAQLTERPRMQTRLLTGFALIGLLLAAIGQFGLVSYTVTQRTAEIGIRMALGATAAHVLRLVGRGVGMWTGMGALVGLAASIWLGRYVEPLLFGVKPGDPVTAILVLAVLATVTLIAALPPALRALHVQPASALRHE